MMRWLRKSPKENDYRRPPLRQSNGVYSLYGGRGGTTGSKFGRAAKRVCWLLAQTVLTLAVLFVILMVIVYMNCSHGFTIIPKSRELCHDVYQFVQTWRIPTLTWDYKASASETYRIGSDFANSTYVWLSNFDLVALQCKIVAGVVVCRDAIIALPVWTYESIAHLLRVVVQMVLEFGTVVQTYADSMYRNVQQNAVFAFGWIKGTVGGR